MLCQYTSDVLGSKLGLNLVCLIEKIKHNKNSRLTFLIVLFKKYSSPQLERADVELWNYSLFKRNKAVHITEPSNTLIILCEFPLSKDEPRPDYSFFL